MRNMSSFLLYYPNVVLQLLKLKIDMSCPPQTKDALPLKERLSLLHKLEKAEARVQTLEAEVKTQKMRCSCTVYAS